MWYHWLIFSLIFLITPFSITYFVLSISKNKELSVGQIKHRNLTTGAYILLIWLYDLLYMAIFNKWVVCSYIFGVVAIIISVVNITKVLVNNQKEVKGLLPFELIVVMALSIYLIYIIEDDSLQSIIMTIVAAVYGGLFALIGVAWTIKDGNKKRQEELNIIECERKEEERKKLVPYTKLEMLLKETSFVETFIEQQVKFDDEQKLSEIENNTCYLINIANFKIRNISNSNYILHGISIDGMVFKFKNQSILSSNEVCKVATTRNGPVVFVKPIEKISLLLTDILGNKYELICEFGSEINDLPRGIETLENKKYTLWEYTYRIQNISLPNLIEL